MTAWTIPRPPTLAEVARRTLAGEPIDPLIREFLDAFYLGGTSSREAAIAAVPGRDPPAGD